jgi:hypothetical protein
MSEPRLFVLAAVLQKSERDGMSTKGASSYALGTRSKNEAVGQFVLQVMADHPGWSMVGQPLCQEVPSEDLVVAFGGPQPA